MWHGIKKGVGPESPQRIQNDNSRNEVPMARMLMGVLLWFLFVSWMRSLPFETIALIYT
jgi:hypothetical protein